LGGPAVVLLIFCAVAWFAAWRVKRSWQDKTPSRRQENLLRQYCTPLFRRRFRRKSRRTLDWNPIAWLQQYSWKARMSKWGLCLAFLLIEWATWNANRDDRDRVHAVLLLTLAGIYTFVGVSGFLEEKRSGALELLLVTPISVNKLIFGRAWGLWKQFLPAGLLLGGYAFYEAWLRSNSNDFFDALLGGFIPSACLFLSLPVFATYFALRVKNLIVAAVLTWVALWLPFMLAGESVGMFTDPDEARLAMESSVIVSYLGFALLACAMLRHSLSRRIYSF
jgi:hypothetical protein